MKKAFTMIELVFILVVVGILSVMALPRLGESSLAGAATQVASHIRYTQHLAMQDDKFDQNDEFWYRERWQIVFNSDANTNNQIAYTIFTDSNHDKNPNETEAAINPQNPSQRMSGGYAGIYSTDDSRAMKELNLGKKYGIETINFSSDCTFANSQRISFDYMGRPLRGVPAGFTAPYQANRLITSQCVISLCTTNPCSATNDHKERIDIAIEPESGYTIIIPKG